ncbi:MAG: MFS transporter [Christensenellales bacterium]
MRNITAMTNGMNNPFASLRHKNFRYYWIGMCVSVIGTWMQNIAQPWLAYTLTESPFLLSLVSAMQFVPILLFSLFAGVIIDRLPKKMLLFITQGASLVITLALAVLTYMQVVQYWHILILSFLLGIVNSLDMPLRQSFISELVEKEHLMNAIALNSTMFNLARIIGPALAGLVMGYMGIAACFLINSISFAAVLISLFFIKTKPFVKKVKSELKIIAEIKDGLAHIYCNKEIFKKIIITTIVATFALNYTVLAPVFSNVVLDRGEQGFGLLMSFMGVGSFLGALTVAATCKNGPRKYVIVLYPVFAAVFHIFVGFTSSFLLAGVFMAACGFFFVAFLSTINTSLQLYTREEYRGRVMSVYTIVLQGTTPIGNLFAGAVTDAFGPGLGFIACGAAVLIFLIPVYLFSSARKNV